MANTIVFMQKYEYDTQEDLQKSFSKTKANLEESQKLLSDLSSNFRIINSQIHYTGSYFFNKKLYTKFLNWKNKRKFRKFHKSFYPDGKMISIKALQSQKMKI